MRRWWLWRRRRLSKSRRPQPGANYYVVSINQEQCLQLRDATLDDADAIVTIYNHFVDNTTVSFEEEPVSAPAMRQRIDDVQQAGLPWLVAELDGKLLGYAYATKWRVRPAYRFSVESSVYLAVDSAGKGLGAALYALLLERLRAAGVHVVIGGIALPNEASVALHEKMGYLKVAHFTEVGRKFDRWIDVGYWQRTL
jgi:L-amino acid N-acyltransferase YncA